MDLSETSCRIVWSASRLPFPSESVTYQVEVVKAKEQQEPIVVRRCTENETTVSGLEPKTEYSVRICPIRLCSDGDMPGTYSLPKSFSTASNLSLSVVESSKKSSNQVSNV